MQIPEISIDVLAAARRSDSALACADVNTVRAAELRYRKFLGICAKYPDAVVTPARDIDQVWHLHMLQPRAYVADCNRIFGYILDHDGGFGKDSEQQYNDLLDAFSETAKLWDREYSEPYVVDGSASVTKCVKACRVACKKKIEENLAAA